MVMSARARAFLLIHFGSNQAVCATEGLLPDPVYSAKGMAGLMGLARSGFFRSTDNVIFIDTGGSTTLFACQEQLLASLS